jgi:DNA-3-methyladenine glycosylase
VAVLPRRFYARDALLVAPDLIGATLVRRGPGGAIGGVIVEVEAYRGADDPASHAYRGPTPRTRSMFGPPGRAYVYFIYGMHHCVNVVTGEEGAGGAVLVRALAPSVGLARWRERTSGTPLARAGAGPGLLARALGLTRAEDGLDLLTSMLVIRPRRGPAPPVACGPRVGLSVARDRPWRFWWEGHPSVSGRPRSPGGGRGTTS